MQFKQNENAVADGNDDSKAKIDFTIHFCAFLSYFEAGDDKMQMNTSNPIKSLLFYVKFLPLIIESCILFPILAMLCQIAAILYQFSTQLSTHPSKWRQLNRISLHIFVLNLHYVNCVCNHIDSIYLVSSNFFIIA